MQTKKTKRFLSVFLSMLIVSSVFFGAKADAIKQRAITYTALGDSISTGYKLSNTSKDYVNLFGKYLNTVPVNLGKNGLDSAGLLRKLNQDQTVIGQIKKSDVITVSMGGNDMLVIFSSLNLDLTSPLSLVNAVSLLQGNTLHRKLTGGVESFSKNWPEIVARLKNLAPDANLVVTTLINPYQGIVLKVPLLLNFDLGAFSEPYIRQINSVIKKRRKRELSGGRFLFDVSE
ncbi:MAG TPA: GDSL-type esterase/lipase family protein [Clostridia bacterium]|nr:GDSL-type esterase/lipase family protein [Clostridia bacterium]